MYIIICVLYRAGRCIAILVLDIPYRKITIYRGCHKSLWNECSIRVFRFFIDLVLQVQAFVLSSIAITGVSRHSKTVIISFL